MTEALDRDDIVRLLDQLGSDQDADVLDAARELHAQIIAAGVDWDELLMPDASVDADDAGDQAAPDNSDEDVADAAPATGKKSKDAETLALIEKLLAKSGRSDALREELEEYKADIANGEFDARDHQYVRALHKRLAK